MIKLGVASTSAVFEPRTSVTAATAFAGFPDAAACGAYGTDSRRRGCWCVYVGIGKKHQDENTRKQSLHSVSLGLTFTGFDALKPSVISVSVAGSSTILVPSTARSTATGSAGFIKSAAFWARHLSARGDG